MTSTSRSPARSCTSCASASSPRAASAPIRRTSEAPTPHRCSSCSSTSTTAGPATTSSSAPWSPTPAPRWTGSTSSGDPDGDGYVEYERRNPTTGLVNQCWKDSWNSIQFADGTLARGPIATCEIQGYVYDAQRRCARLAREVWDDAALSDRLEQRGRRPAGALSPRLLDARARLPRARARRRQTPGRQPDLQHRPPPVVRDPRRPRGRRHRRATARRAALLRLGRPHPRRATRPATTRSATTQGRSGPTTTR